MELMIECEVGQFFVRRSHNSQAEKRDVDSIKGKKENMDASRLTLVLLSD